MTVQPTSSKFSYAGDGVTTNFPYPAYFLQDADLVVVIRTIATGVEVIKALGSQYTVAGALDPIGGSVTMAVAPTSGETVTIFRDPLIEQPIDFVSNDALPAEVLERGFDRATMVSQRLQQIDLRSLKFPETDSASISPVYPASVVRASKVAAFDANGSPTVLSIGGLGITISTSALIVVSAISPSHVNGQTWIDTSVANTLIFKADDGVDFIEKYRIDTSANTFTIPVLVASIAQILAGTENTKFLTADGLASTYEEGAPIASASAIAIPGTGGGYFHVTGSTTINTISGTGVNNGVRIKLCFDGALQLTHSANLILPGSANITTAANDVFEFLHDGAGVWRCVGYSLISGGAAVNPVATQAEQEAASSVLRLVTSGRQQFHPSAAKAWALFNGNTAGTNAPTSGYNVTSVTKVATGRYTINLTAAFSGTTYVAVAMSQSAATLEDPVGTKTASAYPLRNQNSAGTAADDPAIYVVFFGDQ